MKLTKMVIGGVGVLLILLRPTRRPQPVRDIVFLRNRGGYQVLHLLQKHPVSGVGFLGFNCAKPEDALIGASQRSSGACAAGDALIGASQRSSGACASQRSIERPGGERLGLFHRDIYA